MSQRKPTKKPAVASSSDPAVPVHTHTQAAEASSGAKAGKQQRGKPVATSSKQDASRRKSSRKEEEESDEEDPHTHAHTHAHTHTGAAAGAPSKAAAEDDDDVSTSGTESDDLDMTAVGGEPSEESDDSDASGADSDGLVHVDFQFTDPRPIDYKSVRRLVERYLPGKEDKFNASGMADAIIAQVALGTMIKIGDDLDVYAFATLLPVHMYKDADWMKSIRAYCIEKAEKSSPDARATVEKLFDDASQRTALLINERVVNMPPELAPALHKCLLDDLEWARANAPAGQKDEFDIANVLVLAPCWQERAMDETGTTTTTTHFFHFEEELFEAQSTLAVEFPVSSGDAAAPGPSSAGAAAAAGSKRRRADDGASSKPNKRSGKDNDNHDGESQDEAEGQVSNSRPPQTRRLLAFPAEAMRPACHGMDEILRMAQAEEARTTAAREAPASSGSKKPAAAGKPGGAAASAAQHKKPAAVGAAASKGKPQSGKPTRGRK